MPYAPQVAGRALVVWVALAQGLYYVATGLFPFVSLPLFEAVTGPKTDDWLVRTVGLLVVVIGGVLLFSAWRARVPPEAALLGVGSALGLSAIDVYYVSVDRISPVYLADAVVEWALVLGWLVAWFAPGAVRARRLGRLRGGAPGFPR